MAFLCPVRIRNNTSSRKSKKKKGNNTNETVINQPDMKLVLDSTDLAPGRITGSSSIETLIRVGLEKQNNSSLFGKPGSDRSNMLMVVLHDFTPCVDDELEVKRGDVVSLLYREHDWAYVILIDDNSSTNSNKDKEGFIPFSYLASCSSSSGGSLAGGASLGQDKNDHHHNSALSGGSGGLGGGMDSMGASGSSLGEGASLDNQEFHPFYKDPSSHGKYVVLYTFIARDENDLSVERGELITVLNKDDPDWFWVVRSVDGEEGFVPSGFVFPLNFMKGNTPTSMSSAMSGGGNGGGGRKGNPGSSSNNSTQPNSNVNGSILGGGIGGGSKSDGELDLQMHNASQQQQQHVQEGTELVMLYDYKAQAPDDLSVRRGDWVYADLSHQTVEGWLWAFAPKQKKYGFIPKAYARPPAMTSL